MENERILLISSIDKVIIINPTLEDEIEYEGSLILRGNFKIIDKKLDLLIEFIHQQMQIDSLKESLIYQKILNKIYDLYLSKKASGT